jgi:two-component system chemotaxis sensor kinase CheA
MIALSANAEPSAVAEGREAGFTDYIVKFQREALIASLQQCLAEPAEA